MKTLPIIAAAAFLLAATPALAEDAHVSIFRSTCIDGRASYDATRQQATSGRWTAIAENANPNVARIMSTSRAAMAERGAGSALRRSQVFSQPFQDHALYLVLTEVDTGRIVIGCYLYDFDATAPLTDNLFGSPGTPTRAVNQGGMVGNTWNEPPSLPGALTIRNIFAAPGSPAADAMHAPGLVLSTSSLAR